jgi:hypothetical protein
MSDELPGGGGRPPFNQEEVSTFCGIGGAGIGLVVGVVAGFKAHGVLGAVAGGVGGLIVGGFAGYLGCMMLLGVVLPLLFLIAVIAAVIYFLSLAK